MGNIRSTFNSNTLYFFMTHRAKEEIEATMVNLVQNFGIKDETAVKDYIREMMEKMYEIGVEDGCTGSVTKTRDDVTL